MSETEQSRAAEQPRETGLPREDGQGAIVPEDLGGYAFPHDVRVAADGSRAFFEVTRVDLEANRYRTDIWAVDGASEPEPSPARQLTATGEEGAFDLLDSGEVLFVSRRRRVGRDGKPRADAPAAKGCDLFRISPEGGEARLAACLPGLAVRDWRQLPGPQGAERLVVCARALLDEDAPVVEIEDSPFYENGGTYTSGSRWGLYLLDLAKLGPDRAAGPEALRLLTRPGETVDSWTLDEGRERAVVASRTFKGLRPAANELWSLDLRGLGEAQPGGAEGEAGAEGAAEPGGPDGAPLAESLPGSMLPVPASRLDPPRTLLGGASLKRSELTAWRGQVLFLATDMRSHGVNEDPHPWRVPADGSEPERPVSPLEDAPDLYYGSAVGGDSTFGGGRESVAVGDGWHFLSTEFDRVYLRRMAPDGSVAPDFGLPAGMAFPQCFDTADGRVFWLVCASEGGLPEVWRATAPEAGGGAGVPQAARPGTIGQEGAPARLFRATGFSRALAGKHVSTPEAFTFESGGAEITGYVLKPLGYEPGRRCPGVLEIHGGPKGAYGPDFSQEMQCLAAQGYFVFYTNPHGGAGHGVAFSDIRGGYGKQDYEDLMAFTDEVLRRYPDIDPGRLAVMGGSYGGFMTNWVIGHTDRFRCANSQRSIANYITKCLVSDIGTWANMPELTGKLGDPFEEGGLAIEGDNPRRLWEQSPVAYAMNVKTPTLFLHSDADYRCPLEEGFQMYTALQLRGVPSRLVVFKGESHGLCRAGKPQNRVRRLREILSWYSRWLDGDGQGERPGEE